MTAPNQGFPSNLNALLGGGAFQIGGGSSRFGQNIDPDYVKDFILGPLASGSFNSLDGLSAGITAITSALALVPIETLKLIKPFLPGATDADFVDSQTAANFIASIFIPSGVSSSADWFGRLVKDLTVLFDFFHLSYPVGAPSDTKDTTSGGKMTWYAAWADLMDLIGITTGAPPPADPAPAIGPVVADHNDWFDRFITDMTILLDFLHLTYPVGTPSDARNRTIGGKRTYWSAWNDLMHLFGVVKSTSALTDPGPTIGTQVATTTNTVQDLSAAVQELQATQEGSGQSGKAFAINFRQFADGPWPSTDFPITYTGSGTGYVEIVNGKAVWHKVAGADRQVVGRYKDPTVSDYQVLTATIAGLPEGNASNYACVRMNSTRDTYVYGRVFLNGFGLDWELGHYIGGVKQAPLATGSGAPLNFSFSLKAGVGGDPYRFQGISGSQIVFDYTDSAHVTQLGSGFRYFGFRSETGNSGNYAPAPASYVGCRDADPTGTVGTGIRFYRGSTSTVSHLAGGKFASNFFDTRDRSTSDLPNSNNAVTVDKTSWYDVDIRALIASANITSGVVTVSPVVYVNNAIAEYGPPTTMANLGGVQFYPEAFGGRMSVYAQAGDVIEPGLVFGVGPSSAGIITTFLLKGEATGLQSVFKVVLSNR